MKPAVFKQRDNVQLSYELPHHIHASAVYPVRSPNGSRIIIYGHNEGIRVIWYGGRSYRQPTAANASGTANGTSKDEPMVIDLSSDDEPAPPPTDSAGFEQDEDEVNPAEPYRDVLRYIDIALGTSATHISVPHISPVPADSAPDSHASILSTHIVVAVAYADLTIRLMSLPLTPPAKSSIEPSTWGMQVVQIPSSNGHQDFITSISITDFAESQEEVGGERSKSRSRSGARVTSNTSRTSSGPQWSFLVASSSSTGSGLLLIHKISLINGNTFDRSPESLFPAQRQLLRSPLSGCRLSFNPCPHPADRSSNLLITLPDSGCLKIYQVIAPLINSRGRRGSAATMDSATSSAGSVRSTSKQQGKFLITLYTDFVSPGDGEASGQRKRPLDASWVLGGRAILALFEDGEWGVWDLEGAGPASATQTQNLVKGQSSISGIQGGAKAKFTIRGSILPFANASAKSRAGESDSRDPTGLAPMTPHTRKTRSDRFFEGREGEPASMSDKMTASRGSICTTELPLSSTSQSSKLVDESVLLNYGDASFHLTSLLAYWRAEISGRGTLGTSGATRPNSLPALRLGGEHLRAVSEFAVEKKAESTPDAVSAIPDIVATTDHTLIMLLAPLAEEMKPRNEHKQSLLARLPGTFGNSDELLLQRGELGINGLDNMLNDMTNGNTRTFGKSVGFDVDEDMDLDLRASLGTPTPKLGGRTSSARGTPSALFRPAQSKVRLFS
jgi:hypothetical protein